MELIDPITEKVISYDYKKLMIIPLGIFALSILLIGVFGLEMGIDFKGGTIAQIQNVDVNTAEFEEFLKNEFNNNDIKVRTLVGLTSGIQIETPPEVDSTQLKDTILENFPDSDYSMDTVGPTLGQGFQREALRALLLAFLFMAVVVVIVFRTFVPSFAVVLSALSDIIVAAGFMKIFGINLSLNTVAALLMLIGYSVDTDILLTTRLIKRKVGTLDERLKGAMRTGLTMTGTTIAALTVLYLISTSLILDQIAIVLVFGLIIDLLNTWFLNAGILKWYAIREGIK